MKILIRATLAVAAWLLAATNGLAAEPIKIGVVLSISGPVAFMGTTQLNAAEAFVKRVNAEGGVLGRPLQLVTYDDEADPAKGHTFAKRLIENDKVDFIIGSSITGSSMSMIPLAEQAGMPLIALGGGSIIVEPTRKWVFKSNHPDRMGIDKIFEDMKKRGISKIAVVAEVSGMGKSFLKSCEEEAPKYNLTLAQIENYGVKDMDVTAQLTRVKSNPAVQAVFVVAVGQGAVVVTKNYRQLGITVPIYYSHSIASDEFIHLAGPASEGVRIPSAVGLMGDRLPANDPQKPVVTAYRKAYLALKPNADPDTFGAHMYDAISLAANAMKQVGSTDKTKVRDALEGTKNFIGVNGVFNMSPTDHNGLSLAGFRMFEVKGGKWVFLN